MAPEMVPLEPALTLGPLSPDSRPPQLAVDLRFRALGAGSAGNAGCAWEPLRSDPPSLARLPGHSVPGALAYGSGPRGRRPAKGKRGWGGHTEAVALGMKELDRGRAR